MEGQVLTAQVHGADLPHDVTGPEGQCACCVRVVLSVFVSPSFPLHRPRRSVCVRCVCVRCVCACCALCVCVSFLPYSQAQKVSVRAVCACVLFCVRATFTSHAKSVGVRVVCVLTVCALSVFLTAHACNVSYLSQCNHKFTCTRKVSGTSH